jgi:hypothetical protein
VPQTSLLRLGLLTFPRYSTAGCRTASRFVRRAWFWCFRVTDAFVFPELTAHSQNSQIRTIMVHNGVMSSANKTIRQSVTLPATTAAKVRNLAKTRRLSSNRMLVELIENGIEAEKRKQQEFFELADRFRDATDPEEAKRLGDELGRMVFGS